MRIWSNDFADGQPIPEHCAYQKDNLCPHLAWDEVPEGTMSFAIMCNDPDAPVGDWIHWLVHGIPADVREISLGAPVPGTVEKNSWGKKEWGGPSPPSGTHRYIFTLYALKVPILQGVSSKNFREFCEKHKIDSAQTMGTYTRK